MKTYLVRAALVCSLATAFTTAAAADGDAVKGKKVFNKCRACHSLTPDRNMSGPSLAGIVGKQAAMAEKFRYSKAMKQSGWTWDEATLTDFLIAPKKSLKGTKMIFAGLRKPADIENLIAFLKDN